jgi:hypothetical protein
VCDVDHPVEGVARGSQIGHGDGDAVAFCGQELESLRGAVPGVDTRQQLDRPAVKNCWISLTRSMADSG